MAAFYILLIFFGMIAIGCINDYFSRPKCSHCGSRDTRRGCYTRGYNEWCEQADGDHGHYCMKCQQITWDQSFGDYCKGLPKWVRPYHGVWEMTGKKSTNGS